MPAPRIAIIGAGLSGLTCARILQRNDVPVTIYEMDPSEAARHQGGSLDIHSDSGQIALKEAGLYEEFHRSTHTGGEAIRVMDKYARVLVDHEELPGGNGRPEIDRMILRKLLLNSLKPGTVVWGNRLAAACPAEAGYDIEFVGGSTVRADLVIGADGAWSKVRQLLTSTKPVYTGITLVEIRLSDASSKHPEARALIGDGSIFALSDNKYIGGHGGDQIALGCGLRVAEDWITSSGIDWLETAAVRAALLREFSDWAPSLTNLLRDCDDTVWPRPIYALPAGHTWKHKHGVTLVGDAAHLMSPFAGEGANLAMIDGADLARALLDNADLEEAVISYEKKMFPRGAKSAAASDKSLNMMFTDGPPRKLVAFFRGVFMLSRLARPFERLFAAAAHLRP